MMVKIMKRPMTEPHCWFIPNTYEEENTTFSHSKYMSWQRLTASVALKDDFHFLQDKWSLVSGFTALLHSNKEDG